MVSRDRIIQLVKEKKTIYFVYGKEVEILDLMPNHLVYNDGRKNFIHLFGVTGLQIVLEDLYETQEQAEWVAKMHTERTEKFEPPTYEEFEKQGEPYYFIGKSGIKERIYFCNIKGTRKLLSSGCRFWGTPSKENYEKAVLYANALFEGKENENETDSDR